ncbi:hypothetical protein DSO57_1020813 [Entomophthora muscae]|uniref:Uncharacterized protein n=1 Tax=Entomophthora muscae TaxID=34485 RepID=A0ACC2U1G0_9FUNG|nr:hypothetical protein DSO57_1020813 [Entomophthora muscae]
MKEILAASSLPNLPPAQDFSKLGFIYITVLGLAVQVVPHTGSWHPLPTTVNYLVKIAPIVYMAFQAQPASPVGVQSDSVMGRDKYAKISASIQDYGEKHIQSGIYKCGPILYQFVGVLLAIFPIGCQLLLSNIKQCRWVCLPDRAQGHAEGVGCPRRLVHSCNEC